MRRSALLAVSALALLMGGCADATEDADAPDASTTTGAAATSTTTTGVGSGSGSGSRTAPVLADQYLQRYCEVLVVTVGETGAVAEVWGTQGLNDCPQEAFAGIDPAAVAAEMGAALVTPNGPRSWVLDEIVANELAGSGAVRAFNGLDMRSIARIDLGAGIPDRRPYAEVSVERDTQFRFAAGREVHELTAPDGSVYVMQSFSVEIDPTLTVDDLADLGPRLELPEGWTFSSRVLENELVVEDIDGRAVVVQDPLRNTYQLRSRG